MSDFFIGSKGIYGFLTGVQVQAPAELIDNHYKSATRLKNDPTNFNADQSRKVVRQVKDMYDTIMGKKAVQLSLIF